MSIPLQAVLSKGGVLFILPKGPERLFPARAAPFFMAVHVFGCVMCMYLIPALYHYRHALLLE